MEIGLSLSLTSNKGVGVLVPPADLGWTPDVTFSRQGATYTNNYDHAGRRALIAPATTFWVSLTGSNNNDGLTQGAPFRSIDLAVKMANDTGQPACIKVEGSALGATRTRYQYQNSQARSGQATNNATWRDAWTSVGPTVSLIIEPWTAGHLFDNLINAAVGSWVATADPNVWKATNGTIVVDFANLGDKGEPRRLAYSTLAGTEAEIIAEVNAQHVAMSSLYDDGVGPYGLGALVRKSAGADYIRTFDSRDPRSDPNIFTLSTSLANPKHVATSAPLTFHVTGMGFLGGNDGAFKAQGANGHRPQIYMASCRFTGSGGSSSAGGLELSGATGTDGVDAWVYQSVSNGNDLDGFNYHDDTRVLEMECDSLWNGWTTSLANNSSTLHETSKAVRQSGRYLHAQDRSIHDIGSARAWMMGGVAGTRRGADGTEQSAAIVAGHPTDADASIIHLDGVRFANGPSGAAQYQAIAYAGDAIRYRNMAAPSPTGGTGTISPT